MYALMNRPRIKSSFFPRRVISYLAPTHLKEVRPVRKKEKVSCKRPPSASVCVGLSQDKIEKRVITNTN
jgi:hypothetical protein